MNRALIVVPAAAGTVLVVGAAVTGQWWAVAVLLGAGVLAVVLLRGPVLDGPPVTLGDDLTRCVGDLLAAGRRTEAVRLVRQETGARLVPAARAVDDVRVRR